MSSARRVVVITACGAATATVLVSVLPFVSFAYRSKPLHAAIETAASLIALLAALLVVGRFRRSAAFSDLLLAGALLLLGLTNLLFSGLTALSSAHPGTFDTWSPVAGRLLGAAALAVAAFAPARKLRRPSIALDRLLLAVVGTLGLIALAVTLLAPQLPSAIDPALSPESSGRPRIVGHPALLAVQLVSVALYAAATVGFLRRAERTGDELMLWFAAGTTIAAFARVNYFLFPSLQSEWVYIGDFLRLAFYLVLLGGAAREILDYQRRLAEAAVHEERHRMARDLHDGLAQDLAFISTQARRLGRGCGGELAEHIALAADRALDESRHAIAALVRPVDEPLGTSVARAAEEVGARAGADVRLRLSDGATVATPTREALVRIVREAVANAVRHGQAKTVTLRLEADDGLLLSVTDDGRGFDVEGVRAGRGYGLHSMRDRVEALGGELTISSSEEGTTVEVRLP